MFFTTDDLRRERIAVRLSTADLATRAGIKPRLLSAIECGRRALNSENRVKLSRALSARMKELQQGTEVHFEPEQRSAAA